MCNHFIRSENNPILKPNPNNYWEAQKLYNPGVIFRNGEYHMFYRAMGGGTGWKSSIGYAVSKDGENFIRFTEPLLTGIGGLEKRGLEDPRISKIEGTYYMVYAAYDGITPRLSMARSINLKTWERQGPIFSDWKFEKAGGIFTEWNENGKLITKPQTEEWSKSGAMFPEKIDGKYWIMFGEYRIWFATSTDGISWTGDQTPFLGPRKGDYFDNTFVEMGPPPIKTEKGWLVLYHGINNKQWYQVGFLLLDLKNPGKVLFRSEEPIFKPEMDYEMSGMVDVLPGGLATMQKMSKEELNSFLAEHDAKGTMPRVTFCCGATVVNDTLRIFYGAGDSVICTATADMSEVLNLAI
ncbi:MAG: hypothetical protein ABFS32_02775 [Bacteroidota bacterium]